MASESPMRFDRFGRTYHLSIRSAEELEQVLELDDSHWIAMSAPVAGLNGDRRFLDLVDLDHNGRIRTDEMRTAIGYLLDRLSDKSGVTSGSDVLALAAVNREHAESAALTDTADYILSAVGAEDRSAISLTQVTDFEKHLDTSVINGDGIVPPEATSDPALRQFIRDLIACYAGQKDLTGRVGVAEADLEKFLVDAPAYLDWAAKGDLPAGQESTDVLPLGEATASAYAALEAVRPKARQLLCALPHGAVPSDGGGPGGRRGLGGGAAGLRERHDHRRRPAPRPPGRAERRGRAGARRGRQPRLRGGAGTVPHGGPPAAVRRFAAAGGVAVAGRAGAVRGAMRHGWRASRAGRWGGSAASG